jgi:hypothetical protein
MAFVYYYFSARVQFFTIGQVFGIAASRKKGIAYSNQQKAYKMVPGHSSG